jgi:hypothetical protein
MLDVWRCRCRRGTNCLKRSLFIYAGLSRVVDSGIRGSTNLLSFFVQAVRAIGQCPFDRLAHVVAGHPYGHFKISAVRQVQERRFSFFEVAG